MNGNDLGDFLRSHRARLLPDEVGLASCGVRRVAGLRREEVAVLAGMNGDYYARLEQGRERWPSPQILDAISTALRMDEEARGHLCRLAGTAPGGAARPAPREATSAPLRQLLDGWTYTPALVLNPATDLLAANTLAAALFSPFERVDNLARMTFLDPAARRFFRHWDRAAEAVVASLRHATGLGPHHPRLHDLVASLGELSEEFPALWSSHTVRGKTFDAKEIVHPDAGPLSLTFRPFDVRGAPGRRLVVYPAEPGSPGAQGLALLGSLHATRRRETAAER
ncbi:helix-turn-helix transcriptional regulator [Streptomyces sp. NPDC058613]|uniref:helix-turn-helix transcriptional regulator n=1 Tax=unclassified Streptomyces TaxID=2593676 RepID=UPI00365BCC5D